MVDGQSQCCNYTFTLHRVSEKQREIISRDALSSKAGGGRIGVVPILLVISSISFIMGLYSRPGIAASHSITDATLLRGSAFVSAKPFAIATNKAIYWEPTSSFDRRFFSFDYLQPQVTKAGMAQVSISLEHADCQSDVAFRLRLEETEVAVVADDACLESNRSSVASYVHTIPVKANETLSFEYIGGGTLNTEKSFVDVLLLPPNPEY